MKKLVAMLLAVVMAFSVSVSVLAATGVEGPAVMITERPEFDPPEPWGSVTHVQTSQPNGDLMWGFSNIATNMQVKDLIHGGAGTMYVGHDGLQRMNPMVVRNVDEDGVLLDIIDNEDGSRTYRMEIYDDWTFNDGTPVTAENYVFNILLRNSPEWDALDPGTSRFSGQFFVGWQEYSDGETNVFSGVRLYDEFTFSVTVSADHLPFFWAFTQAMWNPEPMHVLAPGVSVRDDGEGAFLEGPFTVELLEETILDPDNGHRFNPRVSVGPYQLVTANAPDYFVVERNMYFRGTWDGVFPLIETITQRWLPQATFVIGMEAGEGDITTGVTGFTDIVELMELTEAGLFYPTDYQRPGFAYLRFHTDHGAAQYRSTRQAVAWLTDRDELGRIFLGGFAAIVNSMYATAWYIYQENSEWFEDNMIHYTLNPDRAVEVLEADGWVYNAAGDAFRPGVDDLRFKWSVDEHGNEFLMPLVINWLANAGGFGEDLADLLIPEAEAVGMAIEVTFVEFAEQMRHMNRQSPGIRANPVFNAFQLATTWTALPVAYWDMLNPDPGLFGSPGGNNFFHSCEELHGYALTMFAAESQEEHDEAWLQLLLRLNYEMLELPLYSNIWFNFHRRDMGLVNFLGDTFWGFPQAIQRAWLAE